MSLQVVISVQPVVHIKKKLPRCKNLVMINQYHKQVKLWFKRNKWGNESDAFWVPGKYKTLTTVANGRGNEARAPRRAEYWPCVPLLGGRFFRGSTPYSLAEWIMLQYCRKPPLNIERTDCDSDAGVCFVQSYWVVVGIFYNLLIRVYEKKISFVKGLGKLDKRKFIWFFLSHNTCVLITKEQIIHTIQLTITCGYPSVHADMYADIAFFNLNVI